MINIIDYDAGNLFSVSRAIESLDHDVHVVSSPEAWQDGPIIIPGVGAFGDAMANLQQRGFDRFLQKQAQAGTRMLGICVGMQVLFESSEESPSVAGLGLLAGSVSRFPAAGKVPHMGWNQLKLQTRSPLLEGVADNDFVYFAHSYRVPAGGAGYEMASCSYLGDFAAIVGQEQLFGVQFHPEKSQRVGMRILENFLSL